MLPPGTDDGERPFRGRRGRLVVALLVGLALVVAPTAVERGRVSALDGASSTTASGATGQYELMSSASPSRPLRWLACRAIDYRINPAGMPAGMDLVVKASMAVVAKETGVAFRYAGTTTRTFSTTSRPASPTIYFAFTPKSRAYGRTFSYPGEIGVGGPSGAWYRDGDGTLYEAVTSGRVLLSTTFRGPRYGAGASWQSLIVHEVGHTLNLAHRSSAQDVMHGTLTSASPGRFQLDELAALKPVMQRTGCDYAAWERL